MVDLEEVSASLHGHTEPNILHGRIMIASKMPAPLLELMDIPLLVIRPS